MYFLQLFNVWNLPILKDSQSSSNDSWISVADQKFDITSEDIEVYFLVF